MNSDEETQLKAALLDGKIPEKGSLGLLAYGDLGLKYWRLSKNTTSTKTNK